MLSNVNADKDQVLQVILVGQAGLRDTLRRPELEQFAQRIAVDYHLEALDLQETRSYIHHRIKVVGGDGMHVFDFAACDAVYEHSRGIPRLINLLCDTALVYGFAEQKKKIDMRMVDDVARDKQKGGIFPSQNKKTAQPLLSPARDVLHDSASPLHPEHYAGDIDLIFRAMNSETAQAGKKGRK
jgi:general secretion pathway protein A